MKATLLLETGDRFEGELFGARAESLGEVVFNTAHTGYTEVVTDPSYRGQLVTFTAPQLGNYGVERADYESGGLHLSGLVTRQISPVVSNFRADGSLPDVMAAAGVPGVSGVDVRAVTLLVREKGAMRGGIFPGGPPADGLKKVRAHPAMEGQALAGGVSVKEPYDWPGSPLDGPRVALLDFGFKHSIARELVGRGVRVRVFPWDTPAGELLPFDALLLSNGPGDPAPLEGPVQTVQRLQGKLPLFGVCLGHQLICLAAGANTVKMKTGHHGVNHPVLNRLTGRVEVSSHNHGFAVVEKSLPSDAEVTHISLYDGAVEGVRLPWATSVQFHPEAAPGPHDSRDFFDQVTQEAGVKVG